MNPYDIPPYLYPIIVAITALGWLALIIFPRDRRINLWFSGLAVPLTVCAIYMFLILAFAFLSPPWQFADYYTIERLRGMFGNNGMLLAMVSNMLAMELVVGAWMARKGTQTEMPSYLLVPCLVATALFAGFGYVLFVMLASIGGRWNGISDVERVPAIDSQPVAAIPQGAK